MDKISGRLETHAACRYERNLGERTLQRLDVRGSTDSVAGKYLYQICSALPRRHDFGGRKSSGDHHNLLRLHKLYCGCVKARRNDELSAGVQAALSAFNIQHGACADQQLSTKGLA